MSILDFAEDSRYQLVAVALADHDVAVILNVKKEKARAVLTQAIAMLEHELNNLGVIENNSPTKQESSNVSPPTAKQA